MIRKVQHRFDVLVIGGGPAGIAAATRAAECGLAVGIVDDNPNLGGQIWRAEHGNDHKPEAAQWMDRFKSTGAVPLCGVRVFHQPSPGVLLAEGPEDLYEFSYGKLVLATGSRERFLPFPGWTLPNVMGAGGLQAMVKQGLPIRGKRVVVAGAGPLLLAVAAYLRKNGAVIPCICEQASHASLARFGLSLLFQPQKIAQALELRRELGGVPLMTGSWPLAAHGQQVLESVSIWRNGKAEKTFCDYLACGFHLVPNIELPLLLGCRIHNGVVGVDDYQETTVPSVFCVGEPTGIGGVELSLIEGEIAGLATAGRTADATRLFRTREKLRRFARALDRAFRLRPELRSLPAAETMVCRCEDVTYSRLCHNVSWRTAKLRTRCGMGPCQGRVCGPATQFLFGWEPDSVRPPIFPTRLESLVVNSSRPELESYVVTGEH